MNQLDSSPLASSVRGCLGLSPSYSATEDFTETHPSRFLNSLAPKRQGVESEGARLAGIQDEGRKAIRPRRARTARVESRCEPGFPVCRSCPASRFAPDRRAKD